MDDRTKLNIVLRIPFLVRVHKLTSNLLYEETIVPFIVINKNYICIYKKYL